MIGLSALAHKLAAELKGKSQDGIPVSALYVKNAKVGKRKACSTFPVLEYDSQSWCTISNLQL